MTHAPYQAYLFDLDGTLVDSVPDIDAALNHALAIHDLPSVATSLTRHWIGHGSRTLIKQALDHHQKPADDSAIDQLIEPFLRHYKANIAVHSIVYPNVLETLAALKQQNIRLAVVTNKLTELSEPLLHDIGLYDFFDLVVCGDTASAPKPDAAPIILCLKTFNLDSSEALMVGDSETDVLAAKAAQVDVACMRDGYNHGVDVATLHADFILETFADLPRRRT
jgi:phosphoglycolate phosphatase